jgi:hypothetical protein
MDTRAKAAEMGSFEQWQRLKLAALAAAAVHLAAGLAMALVLRGGIDPFAPLPERMVYIVDQRALWTFGWLLWNAAALSFLAFIVVFSQAHGHGRSDGGLPFQIAVALTTAGIVADLSGEAVLMGVLPSLAARALADVSAGETASATAMFSSLHQLAVMLTAYVANGLYSLSALVLVLSTRSQYPWLVWLAGLGAGATGLMLSVVALADWGAGLIITNALLVPLIVLWQAGVALSASRRARQATHNG